VLSGFVDVVKRYLEIEIKKRYRIHRFESSEKRRKAYDPYDSL